MAVKELSDGNFQKTVDSSDVVVIDFWAPWCGPCRNFAPIFEEVSEKFEDVVFAKVNTEEEQKLAAYFGIRSIPTLVIIRQGFILDQVSGAVPSDLLIQAVQKSKDLDMEEIKQKADAEDSES